MKKLVLASRNKDFTEDSFQFKFTLNNTIVVKDKVVLERFFFQNIQPQFSQALRTNKFIIETFDEDTSTVTQNIITLEGYYPSVNDLISKLNQLLAPISIHASYIAPLWEFVFTYIGANPNSNLNWLNIIKIMIHLLYLVSHLQKNMKKFTGALKPLHYMLKLFSISKLMNLVHIKTLLNHKDLSHSAFLRKMDKN